MNGQKKAAAVFQGHVLCGYHHVCIKLVTLLGLHFTQHEEQARRCGVSLALERRDNWMTLPRSSWIV